MDGRAGAPAAGSGRNSGVGPEKQQEEEWPEEIALIGYAMIQAYLMKAVTGIGYLAVTWSTVVLLGGFVTALGKKDFWCLTAISMTQAAWLFKDLSTLDMFVAGSIYLYGSYSCAGISLWRIIQRDYGHMDGDSTKANLMPALDFFYSLILCQGALFSLSFASLITSSFVVTPLHRACEFPETWGRRSITKYLNDTRSKFWQNLQSSMEDRRLVKYAVDLLDSESSQDYLCGARMLDVLIKLHQVDVRPLILPSSQKVQKLMDTLMRSRSDREMKELAARIFAHLVCDRDLTLFPGAIRCISALLLGTTTQLPYWNNDQQGSSNQSPQSIELVSELWAKRINSTLGQLLEKIKKSRFDQLWAKRRKSTLDQLLAKNKKSRLDQQGAGDSEGDRWNELILQGLTIVERLASSQHNCRDICSTPDLIAKIMSPIYSETLIQDINIMAWQDVVNGAFRVLHRLIRAPEWTGGRRLALEISCSEQAMSNLEKILDQGNTASQQLQMRAMEILTELALDPSANIAMETKEKLINKQLQIFLDEGKEEDLRITAGKTLLALLSRAGTMSVVCIMSKYNHIVDQVTEILDAKNKVIYRTIAAEILENLCSLHTVDKNHVKNTLLPKVLTEVLTSKKKPLLEAPERQVSEASGDVQENQLHDDEENQRLEHNGQINSAEQNETQTAMMELKEALLSLTSVIFDKLIISAEDFDDVARKVALGEGEFVAKLKTIVEENCEATAHSLRIVKLGGQIAITIMKRRQYIAHFKDQKFVETLSKASKTTCNLESCMLFAGTDGGAKKTARPLLSDLVKEAQALVA